MVINNKQEEVRVLAVSSFSSNMDPYDRYTRCIGCEQEISGKTEQEIFEKYNKRDAIHRNLGADPHYEILYQYRTGQHTGYLEWDNRFVGRPCDACGLLLLGRTLDYIESCV